MKPINFDKDCVLFAENQPEYGTLPVLIIKGDMGEFYTSCWKLSFWERIKILFVGKIYPMILGHQPPIALSIDKPHEQITRESK